MTTPDEVEREHTLVTAVTRLEDLRRRESFLGDLTPQESLELLALGEVVARKVAYGRQLTVRAARAQGLPWTAIGRALGTSKQAAWEAHTRWIDALEARGGTEAQLGLTPDEAAEARRAAGSP